MRGDRPKAHAVKVTDARQQFSGLLNSVFKERRRVIVEKSGIPVAALISVEDLKRLEDFEAERAARFAALSDTADAFRDVSTRELERQVARAVAQVRAERHPAAIEAASTRKPTVRTREKRRRAG